MGLKNTGLNGIPGGGASETSQMFLKASGTFGAGGIYNFTSPDNHTNGFNYGTAFRFVLNDTLGSSVKILESGIYAIQFTITITTGSDIAVIYKSSSTFAAPSDAPVLSLNVVTGPYSDTTNYVGYLNANDVLTFQGGLANTNFDTSGVYARLTKLS